MEEKNEHRSNVQRKLDNRRNPLFKEIQKNNMREQEVQKELKKKDGQAWKDDRVVYIEEKIYIPNNQKKNLRTNLTRKL